MILYISVMNIYQPAPTNPMDYNASRGVPQPPMYQPMYPDHAGPARIQGHMPQPQMAMQAPAPAPQPVQQVKIIDKPQSNQLLLT